MLLLARRTGEGPRTGSGPRVGCYKPAQMTRLQRRHAKTPRVVPIASHAMTSEQAAQLIDTTLDLVHQRMQDLEDQSLAQERRALAAEFREWRQPAGSHIDLMVFAGLTNS